MGPKMVGSWDYRDGSWKKGTYVVTRSGGGYKALMEFGGKVITIGTTTTSNVSAFLNKIDGFIRLKEEVYA